MKRLFIWYYLSLKASLRRPALWGIFLLASIIPFILASTVTAIKENKDIELYIPEDSVYANEILESLNEMDSVMRFIRVSSSDALIQDVQDGRADTGFLFSEDFDRKFARGDNNSLISVVTSAYSSKAAVARETIFAAYYKSSSRVLLQKESEKHFPADSDSAFTHMSELYENYRTSELFKIVFETYQTGEKTVSDNDVQNPQKLYPIHGICALILFMLLLLGNSPSSGAGITGIMRGLRRSERFAFSLISNLAEISIPGIIFIVLSGILEPLRGIAVPMQILIWLGFLLYAALWAALFTLFFRSRLTYHSWMMTILGLNLVLCPIIWDPAMLHPGLRLIGYLLPVGAMLNMLI